LGRLMLAVVACLAAISLAEGVASLVLSAREVGLLEDLSEEAHSRYDAELGWVHEPDRRHPDIYGPGRTLTINSQGFRATQEYTPHVPDGLSRVLCLGDSFTLGFGVDDSHTFVSRMDALCDGLQTVNMGQGGYGLDQDWLWYARDGGQLQADVVLLSFIEADLYRMQKEVFTGYPKPHLSVIDGELVKDNVPVPQIWGEYAFERQVRGFLDGLALSRIARPEPESILEFQPVEPDMSEVEALVMFELAETIIAELNALCEQRGSKLVVAYIPTKKLLYLRKKTRIQRWAGRFTRENEIPFVDLVPVFENMELSAMLELFLIDNHFDVAGNELVARGLLEGLREVLPEAVPCEPLPPLETEADEPAEPVEASDG
jgi:hypothetical protein